MCSRSEAKRRHRRGTGGSPWGGLALFVYGEGHADHAALSPRRRPAGPPLLRVAATGSRFSFEWDGTGTSAGASARFGPFHPADPVSQPRGMSQLTLVRHGQAAAFSEDSDRLTELGQRQAARLGEYWVEQGVTFDTVICGALRRHRQTEQGVAEAFRRAGKPWPDVELDPGWNEYDAGAIMAGLRPVLQERDPRFRKLAADAEAAAGGPERNRYFQRSLEALMDVWVAGELTPEHPGFESFADFHSRVMAARQRIFDGPGGRSVAVFTSGGPIGVNVQAAMGAEKDHALRVNWRVRNASLSEFVFSASRLSFDSFNRLPHLSGHPELVTFR